MGGLKVCGAANSNCGLLTGKSVLLGSIVAPLPCDICCSESGFCLECKCLLCSGSISEEASGSEQRIQCLQLIGGGAGVCGHSAHLDCAINCRMAGVVGSFLDIEYLCRRCDKKMDLLPCASKLVQAASVAPSRVVADQNLRLALKLVQGTGRAGAKSLEDILITALEKAEEGGEIQLIVRELCTDALGARRALTRQADSMMECTPGPSSRQTLTESRQLYESCVKRETVTTEYNVDGLPPYETLVQQYQSQVDSALEKLRKSQQEEFEVARSALTRQMHKILDLYQKVLEGRAQMLNETKAGSEQSPQAVLEAFDRYMESAYQQLRSLKEQRRHLDAMLKIGNGFGSISSEQLREWFHWPY